MDAGIHERREGVDLVAALEADGADLGDLGEAGSRAGGLEVDHGEGDVGEVVAQGFPSAEADVHVALPSEALVALDDVGDQLVHELGRAVGDGEEARPHFAVVEGFAGLLEQGEEVIDGRECELHPCIVTPARDGCTGHAERTRRWPPRRARAACPVTPVLVAGRSFAEFPGTPSPRGDAARRGLCKESPRGF